MFVIDTQVSDRGDFEHSFSTYLEAINRVIRELESMIDLDASGKH